MEGGGKVMKEIDEDILNKPLTQKDIVQLLLHNAQHMVTREEVKSDIKESKDDLKEDIANLDTKISKVETTLKEDISKLDDKISKVETKLDAKISKIADKFDRLQWLIVATLLTVVFKDYIVSLWHTH